MLPRGQLAEVLRGLGDDIVVQQVGPDCTFETSFLDVAPTLTVSDSSSPLSMEGTSYLEFAAGEKIGDEGLEREAGGGGGQERRRRWGWWWWWWWRIGTMSQSTCFHVVQYKCKQLHRARGELVCTYDDFVCNESYCQIDVRVSLSERRYIQGWREDIWCTNILSAIEYTRLIHSDIQMK